MCIIFDRIRARDTFGRDVALAQTCARCSPCTQTSDCIQEEHQGRTKSTRILASGEPTCHHTGKPWKDELGTGRAPIECEGFSSLWLPRTRTHRTQPRGSSSSISRLVRPHIRRDRQRLRSLS